MLQRLNWRPSGFGAVCALGLYGERLRGYRNADGVKRGGDKSHLRTHPLVVPMFARLPLGFRFRGTGPERFQSWCSGGRPGGPPRTIGIRRPTRRSDATEFLKTLTDAARFEITAGPFSLVHAVLK